MSGLIRADFISSGAALDHRRIKELFLDAGKRMTQIFPNNIALDQLARVRWKGSTFEEMWYQYESSINFKYPHMAHHIPGTDVELRNDDSFLLGRIVWSLTLKVAGSSSIMVTAWPVVDGKALWSAQDCACIGTVLDYPSTPANPDVHVAGRAFTDNEEFSMGGNTNFVAGNGRSMTGVLLFSIGAFEVKKSQIIVKSVGR